MPIVRLDAWQVKPGRLSEVIDLFTDARAEIMRMGAQGALLIQSGAGTQTPGVYGVSEWADFATYGRSYIDAGRSSSEWQAIIKRAASADSPAIHQGSGLALELARYGTEQPTPPGSVLMVRGWRVKPGRTQDFLRFTESVGPHHTRAGGFMQVYANVAGAVGEIDTWTVASYPTMAAAGAFLDGLYASLSGGGTMQQVVDQALGENFAAESVLVRADIVLA